MIVEKEIIRVMKVEEYTKKHPNDSDLMFGLIVLAFVGGWNCKYGPEHADKLNRIFECYLSMRDAQIELAESLCTNKDGDKCKANYGASCAYQCIKWPESPRMYSLRCESI